MKRLVIIVEGDTELEFVKKILTPYLNNQGIFNIACFKIKHSKGGVNKYKHLQTDIVNVLYENNVIVTTFIDYYALPIDFPNYEESISKNVGERLSLLERSIIEDIESQQKHPVNNLIPYIQLHEFEALCFSSFKGFEDNFTPQEADYDEIRRLISSVESPEEINNGALTAPSKRLKNLIKGYHKVVYGNIIIETIGIQSVIDKCPRFKNWIETLIVNLQ